MSVPAIGARALGSFSKPVAMDAQVVYGLSPGLAFQESPELLVQDRIDVRRPGIAFQESPELLVQDRIDLRRFLEIMEQRDASRDADMASLKSLVESQKAELQSFRVLYSSHKESFDDLQAIVNKEKKDRELTMIDFRQDLLNHGVKGKDLEAIMGDLRKDMDNHATNVGELRTVIETNHINVNGRHDELYNHINVSLQGHIGSLDDLRAIVEQEKGDREATMKDFRQDLLNHGFSRQTIDELMGDLKKDMGKHATSVGELRKTIETNEINMNGGHAELYKHINVSLQGHAGSLEALKLIVEKEKKDRELTMIDFRQDLLNHGVKGKDLEAIMGELKTDMNKHVSSVGQLGNIVASTENIPSDGRIDIFYERMTVLADKVDRIRTDLDIEMSRREIQYRQVVVASPAPAPPAREIVMAPPPQEMVREVVREVPQEMVREVVREVPREVVREVVREVAASPVREVVMAPPTREVREVVREVAASPVREVVMAPPTREVVARADYRTFSPVREMVASPVREMVSSAAYRTTSPRREVMASQRPLRLY